MYSIEEVEKATLEYFNGDELAANVWISKYALRNSEGQLLELTPNDMHKRLAKEFARIEKDKFKEPMSEEEIYECFKGFKRIVPQGSPMFGIGNNFQYVSLGNCFTIGEHPLDSYGGILYADQMLAQLYKRRCGVGLQLNNIRPKGMTVKNSAKTTDGIAVFMERFSNTTREVAIFSRRGALLQGLSVHHPEIDTFINAKRNLTKVTGANISVLFSDEYMEALANNTEYEQRWPIEDKPQISNKVSSTDVWKEFIDAAWETGDPGALFIDTARKNGLSHQYHIKDKRFADVITNPCHPEWTTLLTKDGIKKLKDISVGDEIWSMEGWTKVINKQCSGIKKVFKYTTSAGVFYGTKDHKIISNNKKVKIKDAESIDILTGPYDTNIVIDPQDTMDGLVLGDGMVHKKSNNLILLCIGKDDTDYFNSEISHLILKDRTRAFRYGWEINTTLLHTDVCHILNRHIPDRFLYGNRSKVAGFLRGIFSANGGICGQRIALKASSKQLIEEVQIMLSSIGIRSYITTNKPSLVQFKNGQYLCKQSYDINITTDREKFYNLIGFIQQYKTNNLNLLIQNITLNKKRNKNSYDIRDVEFLSEEKVFNITVDNNSHTYWHNGLNVSNCGEVWIGQDACRLMLLNLFSYVDNIFTSKAKFNYKKFNQDVIIGQRLMDDMVDLEIEKMEKIIEKIDNDPEPEHIKVIERDMWNGYLETAKLGRRTGLGITALADTLAGLNIKYGSDQSIQEIDKIFQNFAISSMKSSCLIAKELGTFPLYDKKLESGHPFLTQLFSEDKELEKIHNKYGRRNISLTTCAPCGSVSILTQTSSGIEPVFMLEYKRRRKIHGADQSKVVFTDKVGDLWEEYDVNHHGLQLWKDITGNTDITLSPYYNVTANDIDLIKGVEIQAIIQKWLTHSVSKTANCPKNTTKDKISELFLLAYKLGCKGFTIYREGSRDGVLIAKEDRERFPMERPKELPCDVHHITAKGQKFFVLVGLYDGRPYEIFSGMNNILNPNIKSGTIVKKKKNFYKAKFDNDDELSPITSAMTEVQESISRLCSLLLRNEVNIHDIICQLERIGESRSDIQCFSSCLARALKKYIKNGTKEEGICQECGQPNLIRQDGCITCSSCGWSKC